MGAKGNLGIELNLDDVPVREDAMSAYEMMLSESQERMLMVLRPEMEDQAAAIFRKWGLDFAIVGRTTDDLRFRVNIGGVEVANLPIKELGDDAPEYDRPYVAATAIPPLDAEAVTPPADYNKALLTLIGGPNGASRRWVWEQYDTMIQGNTLVRPGGDAGVVRVEGHETKALAFSSDVTPRYVEADPLEGGKQAVAECWRNINATGAEPLAATDNLNFGNPEKPEIMGQLVGAIKGIGEACAALEFPIVSGNVSLYNETNGVAILPTPTIAGVGLLPDWNRMARIDTMGDGDVLFLVGGDGAHLGRSAFLRDVAGKPDGPPPSVDLQKEKRHGLFVRETIRAGHVSACHDISSGGLAVALAEMAIGAKRGTKIDNLGEQAPHALLFGEDQARYVIAVPPGLAAAVTEGASEAGVQLRRLGTVGGDRLAIGGLVDLPVADVTDRYEQWFPNYMAGQPTHETIAAE